jgi:hypothetical protein
MNEEDVKKHLQTVWQRCVQPVHDGAPNVYSETIDGEIYVYLNAKGLGAFEEMTLQWIISEEKGLDQERGYVGEVAVLEQHIPYNKLFVNPWDCYDGDDALAFRHKYIAIMAMMLVHGYEARVFFDDDFSYGFKLPEAIGRLTDYLKEE